MKPSGFIIGRPHRMLIVSATASTATINLIKPILYWVYILYCCGCFNPRHSSLIFILGLPINFKFGAWSVRLDNLSCVWFFGTCMMSTVFAERLPTPNYLLTKLRSKSIGLIICPRLIIYLEKKNDVRNKPKKNYKIFKYRITLLLVT